MEANTASVSATKLANRTIIAPLGPVARYHLRNAAALTCVPFLCGVVLLLLMMVFAKLNLFYLESNGFPVDEQLRDAYYTQVQGETMGVAGFLLLQLAVTAVVSIVVMRWASAPFLNAARTLETALVHPDRLKPQTGWLSESPYFDRVIWLFALRVKNGGENQVKESPRFITNLFFLLKFWATFGALSVVTGYFMGIIINTAYDKIVMLALQLVKVTSLPSSEHFFAAQKDILQDAVSITTTVSLLTYFAFSFGISRYMTTMISVFARALEEDRFPVQLRMDDVYHGLASVMNRARQKIR